MINFDIQPILENEQAILYPLAENDFEDLYAVASNPRVWEQHPNKNRWQREVFENFFSGAMQSKGAFKIIDKSSGKVAGSSRIYTYPDRDDTVFIGYTFYGTEYWGTGLNRSVKTLMLDYLFQFVSHVHFEIGSNNVRSQIAISRLGAEKTGEQEVAYFGESVTLNYIYRMDKDRWLQLREIN